MKRPKSTYVNCFAFFKDMMRIEACRTRVFIEVISRSRTFKAPDLKNKQCVINLSTSMIMSKIVDYPNEGIPCLPVFVCPGKMEGR